MSQQTEGWGSDLRVLAGSGMQGGCRAQTADASVTVTETAEFPGESTGQPGPALPAQQGPGSLVASSPGDPARSHLDPLLLPC